jgi:D-alanine-D-alanine ligase
LKNKLEEETIKIYNYFGIRGMCRIDYLVQDGEVYFLEVNTIPWMTDASILPKAWRLTNRTNSELIEKIIK